MKRARRSTAASIVTMSGFRHIDKKSASDVRLGKFGRTSQDGHDYVGEVSVVGMPATFWGLVRLSNGRVINLVPRKRLADR